MTLVGSVELPKMDGKEIAPGIWLMGEPSPVPGTNTLRCLANFYGALAIVELSVRFSDAIKDAP